MNYNEIITHVDIYGLDNSSASSLINDATAFYKGIIVQFDLTLSLRSWIEIQKWHDFNFVSSCSQMHRITRFNLDDSYLPYTDKNIVNKVKEMVAEYNNRESYLKENQVILTEEEISNIVRDQKRRYLEILYSNPIGFVLTARMTTTYAQLREMYTELNKISNPELIAFCDYVNSLSVCLMREPSQNA